MVLENRAFFKEVGPRLLLKSLQCEDVGLDFGHAGRTRMECPRKFVVHSIGIRQEHPNTNSLRGGRVHCCGESEPDE